MPKGGHARSGASECAYVLYNFASRLQRVDLILAEKIVKEMWRVHHLGKMLPVS